MAENRETFLAAEKSGRPGRQADDPDDRLFLRRCCSSSSGARRARTDAGAPGGGGHDAGRGAARTLAEDRRRAEIVLPVGDQDLKHLVTGGPRRSAAGADLSLPGTRSRRPCSAGSRTALERRGEEGPNRRRPSGRADRRGSAAAATLRPGGRCMSLMNPGLSRRRGLGSHGGAPRSARG